MKRILFLFVSLLVCGQSVFAQFVQFVTQDRALEMAIDLMDENAKDYDYYVGEVLLPMRPSDLTSISYAEACWLIFVDQMPTAGWDHPCKYVYVPKNRVVAASYCLVKDSICPPDNVELRPLRVKNLYDDDKQKTPVLDKIVVPSPNPAAAHTYAVIVSGGRSKMANKVNYWNDCSFIYRTLVNTYGVPKENIKVVMAAGVTTEPTMRDASGDYVCTPTDLDGDGKPDIDYAATKANMATVLNGMSGLTDEDHLLLFVTDHGGYDKINKSSYMYLWGDEKLYPNELDSYLSNVNAGFISVVMGQCYSGGFINKLQRTNRIIATACGENELSYISTDKPFNEFLYHWTSALNGADAYGNPADCGLNIPVMDAQLYAAKHDVYANNKKPVSYKPLVSFFTNSVAADLTLRNIPPTVDLVFDEYKKPLVSELKTKEYDCQTYIGNYTPRFPYQNDTERGPLDRYTFWDSPCVWIRNQKDSVCESEPLKIEKDKSYFVYTKIRNKGVKSYPGEGMEVKVYWAQANILQIEGDWKGYTTTTKHAGGVFGYDDINDEIQPGGETIVLLEGRFYGKALTELQKDPNLCLLGLLREVDSDTDFPTDSDRIAAVWETDKMTQNNVMYCVINESENYTGGLLEGARTWVRLSNSYSVPKTWSLCLMENEQVTSIFSEADLTMGLSDDLVASWNDGGEESEYMDIDRNVSNVFRINSCSAKLKKLQMAPGQTGKIGLKYNFYANNGIDERKEYDIDVALCDEATGKILGGETFRIRQEPRPAINPLVTSNVGSDGKTLLEATNVDEDVIYKWYDTDGNIVGTGATFEVPAGASSSYTVRAEAISDGAISDSAPVEAESSSIKSVDSKSNPEAIIVDFYGNASDGAALRLASANGQTPVTDYSVENGASYCIIPASGLPQGVYQVTMVENGVVTGIKKFAK